MESQIKVAFCFYGQVRNTDIVNDYLKNWNTFTDNFNFDFFISTWSDFDHTKLSEGFKKTTFTDINSKTEEFRKLTFEVTEEGLKQYPVPIYVAYHIKQVIDSISIFEKDNNIRYDIVILMRPDLLIDFKSTIDYLQEFVNSGLHTFNTPAVSLNYNGMELDRGSVVIKQDSIYIENRVGAEKHSKLFDTIFKEKKYRDLPLRYINGAHNTPAIGFIYFSFHIFINYIKTKLWRP